MKKTNFLVVIYAVLFLSSTVIAEPILKRAKRLPEIQIDGVEGFSIRELILEAGRFYRLKMTSDGRDEYLVQSPDGFFRSLFIDQVVINDLEVKTATLWGLEYDDDGTIEVYFVPMRVGNFSMGIKGLELDGFTTSITVR
jgi:hypothetical protein